jgi:hypothetical protein
MPNNVFLVLHLGENMLITFPIFILSHFTQNTMKYSNLPHSTVKGQKVFLYLKNIKIQARQANCIAAVGFIAHQRDIMNFRISFDTYFTEQTKDNAGDFRNPYFKIR